MPGAMKFRSLQVDIIYKPATSPYDKAWVETCLLIGKKSSHVSFEEKFYEFLLIAQCEEDGDFPSTKRRSNGEFFRGKNMVVDMLRQYARAIEDMPPKPDPAWLKARWLEIAERLNVRWKNGKHEGEPKSVVNFIPET